MKQILSLLIITSIFSCGVKQTRNQLTSGDYDSAIQTAANGLRNNKDKKRKQSYIYLLEEAYAKARERDLRNIDLWAKDANPQNLERIYETYLQLNRRQEQVRPLLPLKLMKESRNAIFPMDNYSDEIVSSKSALSKYLYDSTSKLLKSGSKSDARKAFDDLAYLETISPNYKDSKKLREEAKFRGTDFVNVYTKNETNIMIPARLEQDLLDFSTFGLDDKWTVFHSNKVRDIKYDYGVVLNFREIKISPEQVKEKEFVRQRDIKDGKKKLRDRRGEVVLDSTGNSVMVDNMKTVRATILETRQFKACQVTAKVDYIDFNSNQLIDTFPLASEFVFENIFARYKGDKRAIEEEYLKYIDRRAVPFPTAEQMVFDSGEDLKAKLKNIISRNRFRK